MIKYEIETAESEKCRLDFSGTHDEIGTEASFMLVLIYKKLFNEDPRAAAIFRSATMYATNRAMDAIERGEFK